MSKSENEGLKIVLRYLAVLIGLIILEILVFIKLLQLDSSIYPSLMITINLAAVYLFWWKNKANRKQEILKNEKTMLLKKDE
jgi:hypothetical protein